MTAKPNRARTLVLGLIALAATVAIVVALAATGHRPTPHLGSLRATHGEPNRRPARALTGDLPRPRTAAPPVTVSVTPTGLGPALPRSFLGFSLEYFDVPTDLAEPGLLVRVLSLIRVPGDGPELLRIGGNSADGAFWGVRGRRASGIQYEIRPRWLSALAGLTRIAHLRVLLDLNLPARDPSMAASFAAAAERALPHGAIAGFEIGNEPDDYANDELDRFAAADDVRPWTRAAWHHYGPKAYDAGFAQYAAAVHRAVPGVPLAGPELAYPDSDDAWVADLLLHDRRQVGLVTVHRYPQAPCRTRDDAPRPTIARTLAPVFGTDLGASLAPVVALARAAGLGVRVTELGSATCGGRARVSNTFATALWGPDALFSLLSAGVSGVNVHARLGRINAAFAIGPDGLDARPLLLGLIAFKRAVAGGGHLLTLQTTQSQPANVSVWAFRTPTGITRVLALDKGPTPAKLVLHVPDETGSVERLRARHVWATVGATLAGQSLGPEGQWLGRRRVETVLPSPAGETVHLPPYSGALVVLQKPLKPGVGLRAHPRKHHVLTTPRAPARRSTPHRARPAPPATPADRSARRTRR